MKRIDSEPVQKELNIGRKKRDYSKGLLSEVVTHPHLWGTHPPVPQ